MPILKTRLLFTLLAAGLITVQLPGCNKDDNSNSNSGGAKDSGTSGNVDSGTGDNADSGTGDNADSGTGGGTNCNENIDSEIASLVYCAGDFSSDTVIVTAQGGPDTELLTTDFDDLMAQGGIGVGGSAGNLLRVNVHQAQTQSPDLFKKDVITFDDAKKYDLQSIDTLSNVITYFKGLNKKVLVVGVSFGAFVVQGLIEQKGYDVADRYLIMVGRLNIDEIIWKGFSEGKYGSFENGANPAIDGMPTDAEDINMNKLAAGLGYNRYITLLDKYDDLSNIVYAYGKTDEQVGRLTDEELNFLDKKKVTVLSSPKGHFDTMVGLISEGIKLSLKN